MCPAAQLDERNLPLPGLDRTVVQICDGYTAWLWLATPQPSLYGAMPLALLTRCEFEPVADIAQEDPQGDFG